MSELASRDDRNCYLVKAYQSGHKDALEVLCEENKGLVHDAANHFKSALGDEEEFVSEAWVAFIEAAREFDVKRGNFALYASVIMRNRIRSWLARNRRDEISDETPEDIGTDSIDEDALDIRTAVEALPAREQSIVEARYFHDASQEETAADIGISRQRVQQLESRALDMLKDSLA